MAFKDGMAAITKVLDIAAIGGSAVCVFFGTTEGKALESIPIAICVFVMLWTPSWIIKKFIQ